jgi:hypothetical protein
LDCPSAVRVIVMLMMVATVFAALSCDEYAFTVSAPEFKHKSFENTGSFFASGLKTIIPTTVYASIFHYSIPMLSQPVKDKSQLPGIFAVGFGFTTFVYVALGVILGMYFGNADPVRSSLRSLCAQSSREDWVLSEHDAD